MADAGLDQAFDKVRSLLEGDLEHPGLTLYDLQQLVGYPEKGEGPLCYTLPRDPSLQGVAAVRFFYYPRDPEITLIVEIEDKQGKRHLRHFRWNGTGWAAPRGFKSEIQATREPGVGFLEVAGDFFVGYPLEEAESLAESIRRGEAAGIKYLLCPRDNTRIFYAPSIAASGLACPRCSNATLLYKTLSFGNREDPLEQLLREQKALRSALEELMLYLKRKLGP
ncbi:MULTISPECIES: hypothetical protein [unclassified Meiothermus]|uniref:hypothetical protein n=1 Tax=unclassified Meiothermus TaxID=370471 RepID=UPI000D7D1C66|nr:MULTISPECIES: hypothetical protein [unclassified Meiothermus]PZA08185.1 hypothetical protein DNA98_03305 [Meiothermus sp. Pnk-1]RYM32662.1 hypothetical protein EWH23_14010 [Meiothermus sp. PNK-Is4]